MENVTKTASLSELMELTEGCMNEPLASVDLESDEETSASVHPKCLTSNDTCFIHESRQFKHAAKEIEQLYLHLL